MRISPVVFAATSVKKVKKFSSIITCISHNHPEGIKDAEATAMAIYLAKTNHFKEDIKKYIFDNDYSNRGYCTLSF